MTSGACQPVAWLLARRGGQRSSPAEHDVALLACLSSLGLLTLVALVAADQALVPAAPGGADACPTEPRPAPRRVPVVLRVTPATELT